MIQITPHMRIFQHVEPVDFRNGIDGLAKVCRVQMLQDPMSGGLFIFINRRRTAVKILVYDGQGFWLCQKRFSHGRIRAWPRTSGVLTAPQLQVLLYNGSTSGHVTGESWRAI